MKSKSLTLSLALLILTLATAMLVRYVSANFTPVLPSDNIIIETDGRIVGTDKIVRNENVYTFIGNVLGTKTIKGNMIGNMSSALAVHKSNIIIDGAGYTLQGNGGTGIDISNGVCQKGEHEIWNVTVKNLRIANCNWSIRCDFGGNHTFYGNFISNDLITSGERGNLTWESLGIVLWGSSGNNITHCTIGGSPAVYMHFCCSNNIVTENNIVFGVHLAISGNEIFDLNYWSDYLERYSNASEVDSSGIWDMPYAFVDSQAESRTFQDKHPLINPLAIPNFSSVLPTLLPAQEPVVLPIMLVAVSIVIVVAIIVAIGVLVYFKKRKR